MSSKSNLLKSFWSPLLQWLLVFWAAILVLYFQVREGLVRWDWLYQPTTGTNFFHERGLPDPRFLRPPAADAPIAPYVEILKNATGPYDIQWGNAPWGALAIAAGMIAAYILMGWLFLTVFRIFMPLLARLCLALTFGCGAVGIGGEALGMAHRLNRPSVAILWGALLIAAFFCWLTAFRRRHNLQSISADTQVTLLEQQFRASEWYRTLWPVPGPGVRLLWFAYASLFIVISLLVTLHAIGEPVVYWDSLILYVGYARAMYYEGGFPLKVVGQVGVGLGANYPHLYEVLTAQTACLAGYWSDSFAQLLPPFAVTAALVLLYYTILDLSRSRMIAMASVLLVRAVPYGMSYSQFASNYSLAILFTAAFIYLAVRYVRDALPGYRHLMLLVAAGAVHINYLMWGLWPVALFAVILAHWKYRPIDLHDPHWQQADPGTPLPVPPPDFLVRQYRPSIFKLLARRNFWVSSLIALALASPWYIRNTVLTGNPVYAFYSNVFPSKNVNPDVMKSAEQEWMLNGDGLGNVGNSLAAKILGSWTFFVTGAQHWKLAPVFMAFVVPGFFLWLLWWLITVLRRRNLDANSPAISNPLFFRAIAVVAALFLLLWFYAYVVADFYLYQIIIVLPLFGIFIMCLFMTCSGRIPRAILYVLTLIIAVAPGLPMAVMGFKLKKTGVYENMPAPQFAATALRKLFMSPTIYYRMEYGGDMDMIFRINQLSEGTKILTHENRHLLVDPKIEIIHLDDWEVQAAYGKPANERMRILDDLSISWYLYVPNEDRHIANSWLGMEELISEGYFEKEFETSSPDTSQEYYPHKVIPKNRNVLYQRTSKK